MKKRTIIILTILTLVIAFMDISGLPIMALMNGTALDIDPYIIPLIINFGLIGIVAFAVFKLCRVELNLGFTKTGLAQGLKKYAPAGIAAGLLSAVAFCIGLYPFDYEPTIWKVLIEGIVYYLGVGLVEEFYVRGLFLNIVEEVLHKNKRSTELAIIISALAFGLGHIPGMIGMGAAVIAFKLVSTIGMGIYFGAIYKKTNNLWVPIITHSFIDICALPYCFTTYRGYPMVSLVLLLIIYVLLGAYSIFILKKQNS